MRGVSQVLAEAALVALVLLMGSLLAVYARELRTVADAYTLPRDVAEALRHIHVSAAPLPGNRTLVFVDADPGWGQTVFIVAVNGTCPVNVSAASASGGVVASVEGWRLLLYRAGWQRPFTALELCGAVSVQVYAGEPPLVVVVDGSRPVWAGVSYEDRVYVEG